MNEKTISIIMNIVMHTNKRDVIVQLIDFMIDEYYKVSRSNHMGDTHFLIEQILSVLHTSILAHKNAVPNNELLGRICELVNQQIKRVGIEAEGLSILGALATTFNKSFESRAQNFWPHIKSALDQTQ